jgi:anti-sigma factor RsiW
MTTGTGSPHPEIQDLLDGRLEEARRLEVEAHVAGCPSCRRQYEAFSAVRRVLAARREEAPAGLREAVSAAIRPEAATPGPPRGLRPALAVAAVVAIALAIALLRRPASPDLPGEAARALSDYRAGTLALARRTEKPAELEATLRDARPEIPPRVFDFGMMGWRLVGGGPSTLTGRRSTLFVYEGPGGKALICQMTAEGWEDLPPAEDSRVERGITFHVYRRGGVTLVFWREAGAVCVLAGEESAEDILSLAVAKAGMT